MRYRMLARLFVAVGAMGLAIVVATCGGGQEESQTAANDLPEDIALETRDRINAVMNTAINPAYVAMEDAIANDTLAEVPAHAAELARAARGLYDALGGAVTESHRNRYRFLATMADSAGYWAQAGNSARVFRTIAVMRDEGCVPCHERVGVEYEIIDAAGDIGPLPR